MSKWQLRFVFEDYEVRRPAHQPARPKKRRRLAPLKLPDQQR